MIESKALLRVINAPITKYGLIFLVRPFVRETEIVNKS